MGKNGVNFFLSGRTTKALEKALLPSRLPKCKRGRDNGRGRPRWPCSRPAFLRPKAPRTPGAPPRRRRAYLRSAGIVSRRPRTSCRRPPEPCRCPAEPFRYPSEGIQPGCDKILVRNCCLFYHQPARRRAAAHHVEAGNNQLHKIKMVKSVARNAGERLGAG